MHTLAGAYSSVRLAWGPFRASIRRGAPSAGGEAAARDRTEKRIYGPIALANSLIQCDLVATATYNRAGVYSCAPDRLGALSGRRFRGRLHAGVAQVCST
jgi:hypothetical protein